MGHNSPDLEAGAPFVKEAVMSEKTLREELKKLIEAIENLQPKITIVMITHRTSTLVNCKYIYRIENGVLSKV